MERLDFASVMAVVRRNIPDEDFGNQTDFGDSLFLDMGFSPQTAMEFDQGQVCRWINGLARLKQYGKEYTNVIYVNYPGDLKQAVIDLDFADDMPDESDDTRFKRHNRFLRSLQEDTLLIMDNFNATASQDHFLDVMLKYRC